MQKKLLSLFSGAGGMDLGFEGDFSILKSHLNLNINNTWIKKEFDNKVILKKTLFKTVFANDILKSAYFAWVPFFEYRGSNGNIYHTESIIDIVKKYHNKEFNFPDNIDIILGGFPCQDFSVAGKRQGFNSEQRHDGKKTCSFDINNKENRGQLYSWMKEVVSITKPKVFYAENVKGLVSLGDVKSIIENDFKSIDDGYFVISKVLKTANYGIPQNRERIIFIGLNKKYLNSKILKLLEQDNIPDELNPFPNATHYDQRLKENNFSNKNLLIPYTTCGMAFNGLEEPDNTSDLAQKTYSKAKFCKGYQGNKEIELNYIAPTIRAEHHGNIEYRRLSIENGGQYYNELNNFQERRLTVRECARLQTFPDDYEFVRKKSKNNPYPLSGSGAYKIIGNAVPPLFAYHLAKRIESIWEKLFINDT
jgi:DNA (cytosine-5)-methyltransferase 1